MESGKRASVSEIISWVAVGITFPINAFWMDLMRGPFLNLFEGLFDYKPLPALTTLFADLPDPLVLFGFLLGLLVTTIGIVSYRWAWFRRHRVLVISASWLLSFLLFVLFAMAFFLPILTLTVVFGQS